MVRTLDAPQRSGRRVLALSVSEMAALLDEPPQPAKLVDVVAWFSALAQFSHVALIYAYMPTANCCHGGLAHTAKNSTLQDDEQEYM